MFASDCLYTQEHEWVRVEGDLCTLGITDFAQKELGEVVFAELPEVGQSFEATDEIGSIESVKAVAEIYTPVTGEVVEVNDELIDDPAKLNDDPQGEGWLVRMKMSSPSDLELLMNAEQYAEYVGGGNAESDEAESDEAGD